VKVLVTGASGQVGAALRRSAPEGFELLAPARAELDLTDGAAVARLLHRESPGLVINCAAYTAVDAAESDEAAAFAANAAAAGALAAGQLPHGGRMIQVSTDFVFDGASGRPYAPGDATRPLGAYGRSKLAGERAVLERLGPRAAVVRTAWVYAANGRNFARTMLTLMRKHGRVRVVADQVGTPTWAASLAEALWALARRDELSGIHHWTDAGVASWYDFAVAIAEDGNAAGLVPADVEVVPIATEDYPTAARRPSYSVLDRRPTEQALGVSPAHWRANLRRMLAEVTHA
jgi:dTDP-4-dehydrorhamnose reductase